MKLTYDTDAILYKVLKSSTSVVNGISGGIYQGERPDDSKAEDITVNTITLTQDSKPQRGVSNLNIHVSDIDVQIAGVRQKKTDTKRLKAITELVLAALRGARISGLKFTVINQSEFNNPEIFQHYVNLRINWSIH